MRSAGVYAALVAASVACAPDTVVLRRGELGPARYDVTVDVSGGPAATEGEVTASLTVESYPGGATLMLAVLDDEPIAADLAEVGPGRFELRAVEGVSPSSAGEADLASLVTQLDPPLTDRRVRIGDSWASERSARTDSLRSDLTTDLTLARFSRSHGVDVGVLEGTVTGSITTTGPTGTFDGRVRGQTEIRWGIDSGRLVTASTTLTWTINDAGTVRISTTVRPA